MYKPIHNLGNKIEKKKSLQVGINMQRKYCNQSTTIYITVLRTKFYPNTEFKR